MTCLPVTPPVPPAAPIVARRRLPPLELPAPGRGRSRIGSLPYGFAAAQKLHGSERRGRRPVIRAWRLTRNRSRHSTWAWQLDK